MTGLTSTAPKSLCRSIPITAICQIQDTGLALIGQGGLAQLSPLHASLDAQLPSIDLLEDAALHGFLELSHGTDRRVLLGWGANVVRLFEISRQDENCAWSFIAHAASLKVIDWVLSVCIVSERRSDEGEIIISLLDAHNEVHFLYCDTEKHSIVPGPTLDKPLDRRQVMLYHGHILMIGGCLTVASGTIFGQVLFEAYQVEINASSHLSTVDVVARDVFHHHEGSVFGVQILDRRVTARGQTHYRLASCSDDRTVRVYEIPGDASADAKIDTQGLKTGFTDFLDLPTATPSANTGHAMGHISRIWTVLWLSSDETSSSLMTFGEDTTAQMWTVKHAQSASNSDSSQPSTTVSYAESYGFHMGKNIWAASVSAEANDHFRICTGGADGRVLSYLVSSKGTEAEKAGQYTIPQDKIALLLQGPTEEIQDDIENTKQVFCSLEGRWKLRRSIVSQRVDYPSGDFVGEAVLTQRPVTTDGYDNEMLYEEQGQLVLANGLSFPARRNYVYRYQQSSDTITAWFVKPDDTTLVDYLFHQVVFKANARRRKAQDDGIELAEGYHLCVADHYNASYEFVPGKNGLDRWNLAYHVKGPQKDYVAKSTFLPADDQSSRSAALIEASKMSQPTDVKADSYRSYTWIDEKQCLATTEQGRILLATVDGKAPDAMAEPRVNIIQLARLPQLKSHSITCAMNDSPGALIAAGNGDLYHYSKKTGSVKQIHSFSAKIVSLIRIREFRWQIPGFVLNATPIIMKCLKEACLRLLVLGNDGTLVQEVQLGVSRTFLPMSATFIGEKRDLLAVGSRADGLSLWKCPYPDEFEKLEGAPYCQNARLHGTNAITAIAELRLGGSCSRLESNRSDPMIRPSLIATAGRDGMVKIHRVQENNLETVHACKWAYGPELVGLSFGEPAKLTLWGFDRTDFVVVDFAQNTELMRVPCGNAHRNWAFRPQRLSEDWFGLLVWTQANACHFHIQSAPSHTVLTSGGHGREIKAVATVHSHGQDIVATGAEDTDIKLSRAGSRAGSMDEERYSEQTRPPGLQCITTLSKHQTGLTHLSFIGNYLFSAGGKEELFVWRIEPLPLPIHLGVCLQAECPKVENGLLRVTDICQAGDIRRSHDDSSDNTGDESSSSSSEGASVFAQVTITIAVTYSDSSLRMWEYTSFPPAFRHIATAAYGQNCLTCVRPLDSHPGEQYPRLLTASTDGSLAIWKDCHSKVATEGSNFPFLLDCIRVIKTHDNAIKAMFVKNLSGKSAHLVVTGGDDGSVAIQIIASSPLQGYEVEQTRIPRAHAAAVNAVELVSWREEDGIVSAEFATTGSDQKVVFWAITVMKDSSAALEIKRRRCGTAVADASGLVIVENDLLVVGVGMELMDLVFEESLGKDCAMDTDS